MRCLLGVRPVCVLGCPGQLPPYVCRCLQGVTHRWKTPAWGNGCVRVHDTATHHAAGRTVCATPQHEREKRQKTPPTPLGAVTVFTSFLNPASPWLGADTSLGTTVTSCGSLPFCPQLCRPPTGRVLGRGRFLLPRNPGPLCQGKASGPSTL